MVRNCRHVVVYTCLALSCFVGSVWAEASKTTSLQVKAFPLGGPTQNLQPQVVDFRFAPYRWQTCIGLPDDPHKSIVGSDGGLYYDYGGGRFYDFKTRVLAQLDTRGRQRQSEPAPVQCPNSYRHDRTKLGRPGPATIRLGRRPRSGRGGAMEQAADRLPVAEDGEPGHAERDRPDRRPSRPEESASSRMSNAPALSIRETPAYDVRRDEPGL